MSAATLADVLEHHTVRGVFRLSSGRTATLYRDLRAGLLCPDCGPVLVRFYQTQIAWCERGVGPVVVAATGAFGAILLGHLAAGGRGDLLLWNPKPHGRTWSGDTEARQTDRVVVVDDLATTGATLLRLGDALAVAGYRVVGEVLALDFRGRPEAGTLDEEAGDGQ